MAWKLRRSKEIRSKFGPEYDHLVQERGSTSLAEKELERRIERVGKLHIRPLPPAECDRLAAEWRTAQERFVDGPRGAVAEAGKLLQEAMQTRGYPIGVEFDERAAV